ncbi:hypothetical protein [Solitalea canadensis]|uniref:DUF4595 domain-containing protein n=1 Tax=Solitalea canadensis (strain ATCC 29591 / DSM 3403 / JCM 21819 / LMG 8368 / NBRC 15130 / NCIMB 12057 / USAM 9D) TaxID=929556 RepID=H8KTA7_SOLCM|nr:hypothetical protein [Solitalea canadensis]AFD06244.1 hypothetical protein Solca_1140 [Solitalea canadensis DSM 3403]
MKNYALYLLMLCLAVIGCQKDIGEPDADLTAKKDKGCKCKVLYLPVTLIRDPLTGDATHDSTVFKYCDKYGNLSSIKNYDIDYRWRIDSAIQYYFFYNKKKEVSKVECYYKNKIYFTILVEYKADKIYKCTRYSNDNAVTNEWIFIWNKDVLKEIKNATTLTTIYNFEYKNPDDPAELVHWTVGESSTGIEYSNKNYWAKDIKNKELLFVIGLRQSFLPIKKEVLNSDYYSGESNWTSMAETIRLISADYNEADYPTRSFYEDILYYYGDIYSSGEHQDVSFTTKVKYEKVIIK